MSGLDSIRARLKRSRWLYRAVKGFRHWRGDRRFRRRLRQAGELRIVIGAGNQYDPGWIPSEIDFLNILQPADWARYFAPASIRALLAEHVWEHLTPEQGLAAARACFAYLRPGGYLRVAVPDGFHPDPKYIEYVKVGGSGPAADDHKVLYNYQTFSQVFQAAGFEVRLCEYWDEKGSFCLRDWDPAGGTIERSKRCEKKPMRSMNFTSIVLDAVKPPAAPGP